MVDKSITKLERFSKRVGGEPIWVGLDVHKSSYHVALVSGSGLSETFVCPADPEIFVRLSGC
jgi:transposase